MTYSIIQWATGTVGKHTVSALAERPDYKIVGARVYDPGKSGRDLGEICGIAPLGVTATTDPEQIFSQEADCVMYMATAEKHMPECTEDICKLLASGKNVIATSVPYIHPKGLSTEMAGAITAACQAGGSTFHGLGVMPGFVSELFPLILTRLSRSVDQIVAYESLVYDQVASAELNFDVMGFGFLPDDPTPIFADPEIAAMVWRPSAVLVAEHLGIEIEEIQPFRETVLAPRDLHLISGIVRKGTVGAMNFGVRIISGGKPVIIFQHYTRMDPDLAPEWPMGEGWTVRIEGTPSMECKVNIGIHGEDHTDQAYCATAMHAIHAIPYVIAAKPGILTLGDITAVYGADAMAAPRVAKARH